MRKLLFLVLVLLLLAVSVSAAEENLVEPLDDTSEEGLYDEEFDNIAEEDIYEDIDDVKFKGSAGMTPDSSFYFLESLVENVLVGNNPETALAYKEEKVLEFEEMVDSGNQEAAEKALERVEKYNDILKKEVSPELDEKVRESSKATKVILEQIESRLEGDEWDDIKEAIGQGMKEEDKIALAAKISNKIAGLCRALSNLDPLEYSKVCKTDDDAPEWKRDLDRELTAEQEEEAKEFFGIMSECFENPSQCRCDDISVKPFADQCKIIAPLAAECESGNEDACEEMEKAGDPIDLLPDYLQDVMADLEDDYGDSKHDLHIPQECVEAGALSKDECMKVMFKEHAPPECAEALERGEIDPRNEKEGREACEKIMFEAEAPSECIEAGLSDFRECERYMFKLDAPEECLDAGLTGSGRDDWKKCDVIRFKLDAPEECLEAGIDGTNRDDWKKCEKIKFQLDSPQECLDAGLDGSGRDDWKKCDKIRFLLDAPEECHQFADDRNPWEKCQPVQFKLDAPQECLDAGLDGTGRRDWDECKKIQFKTESPQECLDAGLDGSGRRDWEECNKLTEGSDEHGVSREDCVGNQLHICDDNGYDCKCVNKDDYDESHGDDGKGTDGGNNDINCDVIYCQPGMDCIDGVGCIANDDSSCDDCSAECPGASSTSCDKGYCECFYEEEVSECKDGCEQECGDQNSDCVEERCVCLGYGENGPPTASPEPIETAPEPEPESAPEPEPEPVQESDDGTAANE
ncbi:MAG: DUF5667 domain-containing protein [Candidatus Woesearchaeota archaeon]|nr:hypothetical protein [Nanoarchaeota archaeon]MBU1623063.1 hypothetical protein [Nanoarchaeota archaeon]